MIETMVRGVNKQVIEITETGNEHFERAILFVRADSAAQDGDHIARHAKQYLSGLQVRRWCYPKRRVILRVFSFLGAAAGGALTVFLLLGRFG